MGTHQQAPHATSSLEWSPEAPQTHMSSSRLTAPWAASPSASSLTLAANCRVWSSWCHPALLYSDVQQGQQLCQMPQHRHSSILPSLSLGLWPLWSPRWAQLSERQHKSSALVGRRKSLQPVTFCSDWRKLALHLRLRMLQIHVPKHQRFAKAEVYLGCKISLPCCVINSKVQCISSAGDLNPWAPMLVYFLSSLRIPSQIVFVCCCK